MNIEQYRAMKAESEKVSTDAQTETPAQPEQTEPTQTKPTEPVIEKPTTVEIDGKQVPLDELKNGYLRQSDYTKKTQEVKRKERQAEEALRLIEQLQKNPDIAQQLSTQFDLPNLDPAQAQFTDLEAKYYDLLIEKEISELQVKYGEFDVNEVLKTAKDGKINDLDTAYHVMQSRKGGGRPTEPVDVEQMKAQLREELMKELKLQQDANVDTSTIIQSGGDTSPVRDTAPTLSASELKVARMMRMNPTEYAKWRDLTKKK